VRFLPELVIARPVDGVILSVAVVPREATGEGLLVRRLGGVGSVRLARRAPALGAGHEFGVRQRQKVAELGGIDEQRRSKSDVGSCVRPDPGLTPV
jgi:hypothetical protein